MIAFAELRTFPPPIKCLLLGGPRDGQLMMTRRVQPTIQAVKRKPVKETFVPEVQRMERPSYSVVTYRAWLFTTNDRDFHFYAVEGLGPGEIMDKLIDAYATGAV